MMQALLSNLVHLDILTNTYLQHTEGHGIIVRETTPSPNLQPADAYLCRLSGLWIMDSK
jgi:hypothetical protein